MAVYRTVSLVRYEREDIKIFIDAHIDPANGDLVLDGQDLGPTVESYWGDSDYEYWLVISGEAKDAVLLGLLEDKGAGQAEIDIYTARDEGVKDEVILRLLDEKYAGNTRAVSLFREWCEKRKIPAAGGSYA